MSDNQDDLMAKEVDDDLRREALNKFWQRYGTYMIAGAFVIIVIVAGNSIWENRVTAAKQKKSDIFNAANEKASQAPGGDLTLTVKAWQDAVENLDGSYEILSEFRLAAAKLEAGDIEGALEDYDTLSRRGSIDEFIRDLARMIGALIVADEIGQFEDALSRLSLVRDSKRPLSFSAREFEAFLLLKLDRLEEAHGQFESLSLNTLAPQTIQNRARTMRDALATKLVSSSGTSSVSGETEEGALSAPNSGAKPVAGIDDTNNKNGAQDLDAEDTGN